MKFIILILILASSISSFSQNKRGSIKVEKAEVDTSAVKVVEKRDRSVYIDFLGTTYGGDRGGILYAKSALLYKFYDKGIYIPLDLGYNLELVFMNIKVGGVYFSGINTVEDYLGYSLHVSSILPLKNERLLTFMSFRQAFALKSNNNFSQTSLGVEYRLSTKLSLNAEYGSLGNKISINNGFVGAGITYLLF